VSEPDSGFAEIRALAAELHALHRHMAAAYAPIVQDILQRRSRDVQEIEHTLDHLLDCACIPEGLALFKPLCRYYYGINPAATADYVYAYRDMWDSEADAKPSGSERSTGVSPVPHGRDAHATRGFA
jgi:hypothetical protein